MPFAFKMLSAQNESDESQKRFQKQRYSEQVVNGIEHANTIKAVEDKADVHPQVPCNEMNRSSS